MPRRQHNYEQTAEQLAQWIEATSQRLVEGMLDDGKAPFEAPMTQKEKLEYYTAKLWNPDGTPNIAGRQDVIRAAGIPGYVKATQAVNKARGQGTPGADASLPDGSHFVEGGPSR